MPSSVSMDWVPIDNIIEVMEQNTATGMTLMNSVVIFKNRSLQAWNRSVSIAEYLPINPAATPQTTARKISWSMLDSRKGPRKLEGMMPTMVSLMETFIVLEVMAEASAAISTRFALPG